MRPAVPRRDVLALALSVPHAHERHAQVAVVARALGRDAAGGADGGDRGPRVAGPVEGDPASQSRRRRQAEQQRHDEGGAGCTEIDRSQPSHRRPVPKPAEATLASGR